jgi:hypothetical protein
LLRGAKLFAKHCPERRLPFVITTRANPSLTTNREGGAKMATMRIHRYRVDANDLDALVERRIELIAAMRARHPGLAETRLIDLGDGSYIDTWRWDSAEQMQAAFADVANIPEARAAMQLTHDASADNGDVIDER